MANYEHLSPENVLSRLMVHRDLAMIPNDGDDDWYYLSSDTLSDHELYAKLAVRWKYIVGHEGHKYALFHCCSGEHEGVWFHFLPNSEYAPGFYRILTF